MIYKLRQLYCDKIINIENYSKQLTSDIDRFFIKKAIKQYEDIISEIDNIIKENEVD